MGLQLPKEAKRRPTTEPVVEARKNAQDQVAGQARPGDSRGER